MSTDNKQNIREYIEELARLRKEEAEILEHIAFELYDEEDDPVDDSDMDGESSD